LNIDIILMLMAGSTAIIVITAGTWIYLLTRKDNWKDYSDGDPKDDNLEYEEFMENFRKEQRKGPKKDFTDDDVPF